MKHVSFRDLDIWKKGVDIADEIYDITAKFPENELYGLSRQMQRAAVSIPSNIAEGFRRYLKKDYIRFLRISLGSCAELETQLIIASRRNFIARKDFEKIIDSVDHESCMLVNFISALNRQIS